jgi:hypothetical protein
MTKQTRSKVPEVDRVVNTVTGEGQELSAARESGWYSCQVKGVAFKNPDDGWCMQFYNTDKNAWWVDGKWISEKEMLHTCKIHPTRHNPVPADEVEVDACVQVNLCTKDKSWWSHEDTYESIEDALIASKSLGHNAESRAVIITTETRVAEDGEL